MELPKYTGKDYYVLGLILLPVSVIMSYAAMGNALFADYRVFLTAFVISAVVFSLYFMTCGWWAVRMKVRFRREADTGKKLFFMISAFLVMSGLVLLLIFNLFEQIPFFHYKIDQNRFIWAYLGLGFVNIFLSFLFEGISRFEEWKANVQRQQQLQQHFRKSQLQGLKSQVNPHFLFNSLNSLSSLIEEDTAAAEKFLDELSKVYRYLLRPEAEQLVPLKTELRFLESYLYLLKARFGRSLESNIRTTPDLLEYCLPALTLHLIVENAVSQNIMSKQHPLVIEIGPDGEDAILVRHNINPKLMSAQIDREGRLDELIRKCHLLQQPLLKVREEGNDRLITIPFIKSKEAAWQ